MDIFHNVVNSIFSHVHDAYRSRSEVNADMEHASGIGVQRHAFDRTIPQKIVCKMRSLSPEFISQYAGTTVEIIVPKHPEHDMVIKYNITIDGGDLEMNLIDHGNCKITLTQYGTGLDRGTAIYHTSSASTLEEITVAYDGGRLSIMLNDREVLEAQVNNDFQFSMSNIVK